MVETEGESKVNRRWSECLKWLFEFVLIERNKIDGEV